MTDVPQNPSFVLQKPHHVSYEDRPVPDIADPFDVLVQVKYTGICGYRILTTAGASPLLTRFAQI